MQLVNFRVKDFRSVSDSTPIDTKKVTAIVGRNESGKTNLLLALHSLNPADGIKALLPIKDFPRHRRLEECKDETVAVESTWELSCSGLAVAALIGGTTSAANEGLVQLLTQDCISAGRIAGAGFAGGLLGALGGPVAQGIGESISRPVIGSLVTAPAHYGAEAGAIGFAASTVIGAAWQ